MALVVSVNVGKPAVHEWQGKTVRSGIWKRPVDGRVMARRLNLDGDGQADLMGHGGEQRALLVYQVQSYRFWEQHLGRDPFEWGMFGENLTVDGLSDTEVCIGDRYQIGGAIFEVSQPRVTCYKVGMKLGHPQMPALMVAHKRPGFYFRVIKQGEIGAGDEIIKVMDGPEGITVAAMDQLLYSSEHPVETVRKALRIEALSPGWQGSMHSLLDAAEKGGAGSNAGLTASAPPLAWKGYRPLKVLASRMESEEIRSFLLADPDGIPLPTFAAGQSITVKLKSGGRTVIRNYSLSASPGAQTYRIAVKNEHGLASGYLHEHVQVGDFLEVGAPRGSFTLDTGDDPVVLLSAGVGITPVLAMLHALRGSSRDVWWIHSARGRAHHAFAKEVEQLIGKAGRRWVIYSNPEDGVIEGRDFEALGHLEATLFDRLAFPKTAQFYLCGPGKYLELVPRLLETWGAERARIHLEAFGPEATVPAVPPHQPTGEPGTGPMVNFARSGLAVRWNDRFESLLELAEACSVPVRWSCRAGVCHNCESGLVGGRIAYSPDPIDPPDEGNILICCAKPIGEVDLDL